jgi:hypothetical protein
MTECKACADAAVRVSGLFHAGCSGCCARAAARSPQFREARDAGKQTRGYRRLLDQLQLTHQQVIEAGAMDFEGRSC